MDTSVPGSEERPRVPLPDLPDDASGDGQPALEVRAVYNGVLIGASLLPEQALRRQDAPGVARGLRNRYLIGPGAAAHAPAAGELLGGDALPLVSSWGRGFLVQVTPQMTGLVVVAGKTHRLRDYLAGRGNSFLLPDRAHARIECGRMSFLLDRTGCAPAIPKPRFRWRRDEHKFTLGSALVLGLFLAMVCAVPPEGKSLSSDLLGADRAFSPYLVRPMQPEPIPDVLARARGGATSPAGPARTGKPEKSAKRSPKRGNGGVAARGARQPSSKAEAAAAVLSKGLLGVLRSVQGAQYTNLFASNSALGDEQEGILDRLAGTQLADGYRVDGMDMRGTGWRGGGGGDATIGPSHFYGTVGPRYGRGAGIASLTRPIHRPPRIVQGIVTTRGSLDKQIIRRVVRLHINEVKYCYDRELVRKAGLAGRISVQFVISAQGLVISSILGSTTMHDTSVEKCVVDAVRRWQFPKPTGGGIAIVSYPFNFLAGG